MALRDTDEGVAWERALASAEDWDDVVPVGDRPWLSPREAEVLAWIAAGKSDGEIGQIIAISAKTVNFHVERLKRKLAVATRVQAVVKGLRLGLIG